MRRFYYLANKLVSAKSISDDLHALGISDWNFHVMSKDEAGLVTHQIHSTTPLQERDIIHSGERGALLGFGLGFLLVTGLKWFGPLGQYIDIAAFLALIALITCFGAWVGGMVGISHDHYKIARFHDDIEAGKYLIMVDVDADKAHKMIDLMARKHHDAVPAGTSSPYSNPLEGLPWFSKQHTY
ncbi:MAG TPA: hypothetical protein VIM85_01700 [Pseudomonadales bacterium]